MKQFLKSNYIFFVLFFLHLIICFLLFRDNLKVFLWVVLVELIGIILALSPLGEILVRLFCGARKIMTNQEAEFLYPLFYSVYQDAIKTNPSISRNIKLYIDETPEINGFAVGSNTIAITRGAIETLDEQEIRGLIAHEFGHIANGDTKALLIYTLGNGVLSIITCMISLIIQFFISLMTYITFFDYKNNIEGSGLLLCFLLPIIMMKKLFHLIFTFFGFLFGLLISFGRRQNERQADYFAFKNGYGEDLLQLLYSLNQINLNSKLTILEKLKSSHPIIPKRIMYLEQWLSDNYISE